MRVSVEHEWQPSDDTNPHNELSPQAIPTSGQRIGLAVVVAASRSTRRTPIATTSWGHGEHTALPLAEDVAAIHL